MRPRAPEPLRCRTWTVELRPHQGDCLLVCPHCTPDGGGFTLPSARSAVLDHLARHARRDALAPHLRTCQCHERGCRWHPRHRGCAGPVLLVLARERGGRTWRLADTCTACAAATQYAAVVPEAVPDAQNARSVPRHPCSPDGTPVPGSSERVRDMLSYLAAALPVCSAAGRLLALQCALRTDRRGQVLLPAGLLRGMRHGSANLWRELEQAHWLHHTPPSSGDHRVQLLDPTVLTQTPGRAGRAQAADWALRTTLSPALRRHSPQVRLTALALRTHLPPGAARGSTDSAAMARICTLPEEQLETVLARLAQAGVLNVWEYNRGESEVHWLIDTVRTAATVTADR
ncbi:hypothetical protein [Streptomyces sp. NBC_00859]|uniref:hypothetical protein n=1 Tax=Streptomyces sp. NBC_00859 TaxID=2903682 RepID=UPI003866C37E|nr:hypothetical protein OG584_00130 [Streptomyces sp. NBC_00859]WSZ86771.1 hypothetical protein OG584_35010 [Streptomyces sp. NBC_00859]